MADPTATTLTAATTCCVGNSMPAATGREKGGRGGNHAGSGAQPLTTADTIHAATLAPIPAAAGSPISLVRSQHTAFVAVIRTHLSPTAQTW